MNILNLTLKKAPFDVMITGEKSYEIRAKGNWINSRLFKKDGAPKHYDAIKFTNGYGKDKPYFIVEYKGFKTAHYVDRIFSNGFHLKAVGEFWYIELGKIIETGNLKAGEGMKIKELDQHCGNCNVIEYCGNVFGYCLCHDARFGEMEENKYRKFAEAVTDIKGLDVCENCGSDCTDCEHCDEALDYYCEQIANYVARKFNVSFFDMKQVGGENMSDICPYCKKSITEDDKASGNIFYNGRFGELHEIWHRKCADEAEKWERENNKRR